VLQEDHRTGDREASSRDFQWVVENQELDLLEGSTPSEAEGKPTSGINVRRDGKVGAQATRNSFSPWLEKKERKWGKPLDYGANLE
jgi:hypothetical protein